MKTFLFPMLLCGSMAVAEDAADMRTFLFIGTSNSAAWEMQIANPADRAASVKGGIEQLGGELLSYYWGLGNGKNYITVALPDDPTFIQAFYVSRLGDGLLDDYQMIELMSSADMATALARVPEIKAADDLK
ncbi:hypothetical protein Q8W37_02560 [Shimia thalassica]|uniref:hypothetical protein n=1 Tax=Shimia thalassica TaxID=1715693 RepID=UPI00273461BE|nr:hypothetical protein [Shimia thalassica]MDP2578795.1 hypothetical protein [Shimia thalassica]